MFILRVVHEFIISIHVHVTSSPAVNGGASRTAGTPTRCREVRFQGTALHCAQSLGRQVPCLDPECPVVLSPALPSASMSLPSGFSGRLSPRRSSGGEPDEHGSLTQAQPTLLVNTD
ncbi:MAG: hypothetical protein J07HQW2_02887 [Haloquadratum walsbyi J07HQW2]|uniref:Uncharacterized protein n=1 Tax=Haloquadratum walsbyi J07HQW2 TaxID=1238425 RepID=U1N0R6_9EURY|nr:MAG: hypothetical protein J07HQW2_02887 [Haloquadratum walsbyi J07HQW2]